MSKQIEAQSKILGCEDLPDQVSVTFPPGILPFGPVQMHAHSFPRAFANPPRPKATASCCLYAEGYHFYPSGTCHSYSSLTRIVNPVNMPSPK